MQTSEDRNPTASTARGIRLYQACFVLLLTLGFSFVMFMSSTSQGFAKFEEGFFQRNYLIENFNRLRIKLGDRVINSVLVGNDGWLEFTRGRNLDDYQNVIPFSAADLEALAGTMQACYRYAEGHDITFLVVMAPNKASIYPDKLPEQIRPLSDTSRLDQLNSYLRAHQIPEVLDLRTALREARKQREVYYKLGTHWNEYGAYIAYKTILQALSQSHPDVIPYPAKFFRFRSLPPGEIRSAGDIARLIQANYLVFEPVLFSTRDTQDLFRAIDFPASGTIPGYHKMTWIPDSELPALLIYHDSFGPVGLNNFLAMNFSKVFYIQRSLSSGPLDKRVIEQFTPDILIYEVVERNLHVIQNQLSGCAEE
jgi:alginate O-acetyltransferase complex protein AlgJ